MHYWKHHANWTIILVALTIFAGQGQADDEADVKLHKLRAGKDLTFTVDIAKRAGLATRETSGHSCHKVSGWTGVPYGKNGKYTLHPKLERAVTDLRLPMTRFYALGDETFDLNGAIDRAAEFCKRTGIPQETTVLEFENQGARTKLSPKVWADGVKHSKARGYKFRYWEITNEPWTKNKPPEYLAHFMKVSSAIRKADPDSQIGISIWRSVPYWGNAMLLEKAAGHYDFVSPHYYDFTNAYKSSFEDVVLTGNFMVLDQIRRNTALIRKHNPKRNVYQYDTEWGLHGKGPGGKSPGEAYRNMNIYGVVYRGVRMIYYVRDGMLRGASGWEMFIPLDKPFGLLSHQAPEKRSMLYWLYYYFNRHVGQWVLTMDGTAPYHQGDVGEPYKKKHAKKFRGPLTPAVLTTDKDGTTLYLIVANGSWDRTTPLRMTTKNFTPAQAVGVLLSHNDRDAHPFLKNKKDFVSNLPVKLTGKTVTTAIPPHSVVFIKITGQPASR